VCTKKGVIAPASWDNSQGTQISKIEENKKKKMGIGWRGAGGNNFEFAKDLMEAFFREILKGE